MSSHDAVTSQAGTVGSWVASIDPRPPAALAERLAVLLAPFAARPIDLVPESCLEAGERLLDDLLGCGSTSRGTALDLLAVDALVTYAFQEAAHDPARLELRAAQAMARIAALPAEKLG